MVHFYPAWYKIVHLFYVHYHTPNCTEGKIEPQYTQAKKHIEGKLDMCLN